MPTSPFDPLFTNTTDSMWMAGLANMLTALLFGLLVAAVYRLTFKGASYSASFVITLIMITLVTSMVIMVIGSNLARAFGLVGAMSIIRFRAAIKEIRDIGYVFFALAVGMAAGSGNHAVGIVGVITISIVLLGLYLVRFGQHDDHMFFLKFWIMPDQQTMQIYHPVFSKYLSHHQLLAVRSARLGEYLECSFRVTFRESFRRSEFVSDLSRLEGIERVALLMGEEINDAL
ncbi:DUF4956 domain-containing protein [candidate division KSB1 bacterium]|nr:DUF4956 domain-containing protein [candidate division KSB1 bacterium]